MDMASRSLLVTFLWSITVCATPVTILEKQLDLGKDPETQKTLMVKAYGFAEGTTKEDADTRWLAVFPYENELMFFSTQNGLGDLFPITNIISKQQEFKITIDPTAKQPIIDTQKSNPTSDNSSLVTMQVKFSPSVQIFKDLLILIAKGDVKSLARLIDKHSLKTINEILEKALDSQGAFYIEYDDKDSFESIMKAKQPVTVPVTLTGKLTFVPMQAIIEEILAEAAQEEQNGAITKS